MEVSQIGIECLKLPLSSHERLPNSLEVSSETTDEVHSMHLPNEEIAREKSLEYSLGYPAEYRKCWHETLWLWSLSSLLSVDHCLSFS